MCDAVAQIEEVLDDRFAHAVMKQLQSTFKNEETDHLYIQEQARRRQRRPRECDAAAQKDQLRISRHGEGGRHVPPHVLSRLFQLLATKLVKRLVTYIYKNMQDSELQVFSLEEYVARKVQQSLDTYPGIVFKPRISFPFIVHANELPVQVFTLWCVCSFSACLPAFLPLNRVAFYAPTS